MKVTQLIKQLNNTQLGKGGTHDSYVLIPSELYVGDIFQAADQTVWFTDPEMGDRVAVKYTVAREKRLSGLGPYYRRSRLEAGDEIIFEKRIYSSRTEYYVRTRKHPDRIAFQKARDGFEILTPERMMTAGLRNGQLEEHLRIIFLKRAKKQNNSPDTTDFYDIEIEGKSILGAYSFKDIGLVDIFENTIRIQEFYGWKKNEFMMEE